MNMKTACVKALSLFLAAGIILLTGCQSGSSQSSQSESSPSGSESEKVPADLTGLENNIETIIGTLGGPAVQVKQQESESSQSGQEESSVSGSQSSQSGQEGSSVSGSQSSRQSQSSSASQQDPMDKISSIIEKMHYQWNNLMPEAVKKGTNKDLVNNFDNSLNRLSNTVNSKNKTDTLTAANDLYAYIPDLYSLFNSKSSPAIKRIRYYSRSAVLNSQTAGWTKADSDIGSLKSVWAMYQSTLGKEQQDLANKLDLSVYELEKVVKERNPQLVNIKGRIVLSNTEALEKSNESQSGSN